ncbi:helix-turn-helix domain-containing protein [Streptomyces filamentosus]|uniref:Helix-turn-helix domain-containing protein n=2 Tax=Streptomyces filamentosus TaxID=67294 RepID=A0ABY4UXJ6_STRFL|nr:MULTISPECIES: helix-turn-helix transcriptional regulator [Streptomyces]EFE75383.1 transcriptional regulator [Streptomyces filamentosus NRRL 15998]MYR79455.1 helix-turn-helix domain-containing protein [Streptomyces sp. SID5466]USC48975.1 helix-turn-helix domain-containing protein [Streptomyces filamentosus]
MAQSDMPTMRSRRLGGELRQLRLNAGLKVQDAAEALECGQPKISQIENGKRGIRPLDLTTLLNLYGLEDERQRASLKRLAKEIHKVDWWAGQGPFLHDALKDYLMLEADSQAVRAFEPMVIPGLLQTEAYMRRLYDEAVPADQVEALVDTRMRRKVLLDNKLGFRLRTVIDAPALHRIGGGPDLVAGQLAHLLEAGSSPNVTIQVLPLNSALPIEQYVSFSILGLEADPPVEVVWLEHITGGTLLEQNLDVQAYGKAWDELTAAALSPTASRQYIRDLIEESRS